MSRFYVEVSGLSAEALSRKENIRIKRINSRLQTGGRGLKFDKKPELADVDIFNTIAKAEDQLNLAVLTCLASLSKDHGYNPSIPKVKYNYLEAFKRALEVSVGEVSSPLSCNCQFCRTDIDILIRNISAPLYFSELGLLVFPNTKSLLNEAIRYYLAT